MSAANSSNPATTSTAFRNKKKKSKKKANGTIDTTSKPAESNGVKHDQVDAEEDDEEEDGAGSSVKDSIPNYIQREDSLHMPSSPPQTAQADEQPVRNGAQQNPASVNSRQSDEDEDTESDLPRDSSSRLDAMQQERDSLRAEVTQLRQSLESLQERHNDEFSGVKEELEVAQQGKEHFETQYRNLMTKVNQIRSQLGDRLKEDQDQIRERDSRIEELEASNNEAKGENQRLQESISKLNAEMESNASEIESLRSRTNISTTNWARERDDLVSKEAYMREEYKVAKQAMQDWEILATEERSRREALEEKAQELEDQLNTQKEAYERVKSEAETQSNTVDGLQRALRDLQEERKRELREMVEQSQSQLEELRQQTKAAEETSGELQKELTETKKELERALPFEREVKEKNLLLGKSRHQAVTLNEHLTRALRLLARGKPEDNVDRHLVTNYLMQFLALDRSDAKKFQVLQLIAALLGWTEEQKEQAGLVRQGSLASGSLKLPVSPFRRTPSTPSLSTDFTPDSPAGATKESLAELWSEFLEREAEAGLGGGSGSSRRGSLVKSMRSPSLTSGVTSPISMPGGRQSREIKRTEIANTTDTARTAGSS